ncbi:uncharacterized protein LOC135841410 [Planococcus citri]|uniref:uncharacterized protein LOC135841410 n=1 Tax=Planococcus citri TaxID=170843 RepID=UPI0031F84A7B
MMSKKIIWTTLLTVLHVCTCNDMLKAAGETNKISSRDYPSASGSSYYTTFAGYPSYASTSAGGPDPFKPSDYNGGGYYNSLTPDNKKKPTYPPPPYPTAYYPSAGSLPDCQDHVMSTMIGDFLSTSGVPRVGILRTLVGAVTAAILTKIPIILAVKALIVKMFLLPLGFLVLSLPILLPILLLFTPLWNRIREVFTGTTTPSPATPQPVFLVMQPNTTNTTASKARSFLDEGDMDSGSVMTSAAGDILVAVVQSDRCLEKLACQLGSRDSGSVFVKPVSWLLKFLQTFKFVQKNVEIRSALKRYRDAYLQAVTISSSDSDSDNGSRTNTNNNSTTDLDDSDICTDDLYPCNIPALYARPEFASYSRYL